MKCCRDCYYSYHRSEYDIKKNGSREHTLECMITDRTVYKFPADSCDNFVERNKVKLNEKN